jgi:6,7-dimethyl-8-ribityllumazine synthase
MRLLVISATFYDDIHQLLLDGAMTALKPLDAVVDNVIVPGVLEIAPVIAFAAGRYNGFIALGCVIRGETSHYDIVCNTSANEIYRLSTTHKLPVGNGILTVENHTQAVKRAAPNQGNKGKDAALACLTLIDLKKKIELGTLS